MRSRLAHRSPGLLTALLVATSVVVAFALRVVLAYRAVFGGTAVSFIETDAYYHMRLVDALVRNFPRRIWFDPYLHHPGGEATNVGPFFDWLIAGVALLLGGGHTNERLIDLVGAFTPPVLGALTVIPVYVLGRELFSRRAGFWAAFIVGVLPGEILTRSLLGFTDHHCAEVLLSALTMMWIVLASEPARPRGRRRLFATLGGVSLGCYLLTWSGGALLVAIVVTWAIAQMAIEAWGGRDGRDLLRVYAPLFVIAGLMVLPWVQVAPAFGLQVMGLGAGLVGMLILFGLATAMKTLGWGRAGYVATVLTAGMLAGLIVVWVTPEPVVAAWHQVQRLSLGRSVVLAAEALPLMRSPARLPFPLWNQFTTSLGLAAVAFVALAVGAIRRPRPARVLLIVWTGAMLLATIGQVRFSYYLGVNVALCAGAACEWLLSIARSATERVARLRPVLVPIAAATLTIAIAWPNATRYQRISLGSTGPSSPWIDALNWLRVNTPDPFGEPAHYYATPAAGAPASSEAAYGVLTSWDKGYAIIRIAHRVPIANPRQTGARETAGFLLAQDESSASMLADRLGADYVIVDWDLQARVTKDGSILAGFLQNMVEALGQPLTRYVNLAYRRTARGTEFVLLYEAAYDRTMMSRMYRATSERQPTQAACWVVTTGPPDERNARELLSETPFRDYEAAQALAAAANSPDTRVVGLDPLVSCLPVAPLTRFSRVYRSIEREGPRGPSVLQIFGRLQGPDRASDKR